MNNNDLKIYENWKKQDEELDVLCLEFDDDFETTKLLEQFSKQVYESW